MKYIWYSPQKSKYPLYICSQKLLSVSLSEYSVIKRGNFNGNRSVPSNFMSDIEYSVIKSDVIKSFDCNKFVCSRLYVLSQFAR